MGEPPSGLSIALETIEWPEPLANWVWFVGGADAATDRAVLRFFRADVGKRALGADGIELKLASALLRLRVARNKTLFADQANKRPTQGTVLRRMGRGP